jgi:hypothetical protein
MKWLTRDKVKVDRVACPWLIRRFIDPQAESVFVPASQVETKARELGATPLLNRKFIVYDALYAECQRCVASAGAQ